MPLDFPTNPYDGQVHSVQNRSWQYSSALTGVGAPVWEKLVARPSAFRGADVPWTRNATWLTLPDAPVDGMSGLYGVENNDSNYVAVYCTVSGSGTYTVDWGDGSSTTVATGVLAEHKYEYAAENLTDDGLNQRLVTITPQSGKNITVIDLCRKHSRSQLQPGLCVNWLDLNFSGASMTQVQLGTAITGPVYLSRLERCHLADNIALTTCGQMFGGCSSLRSVNLFNTSAVANFSSMFNACRVLTEVPQYDTANGTTLGSMFQGCYNLKRVPLFTLHTDIARPISLAYMFHGCYRLVEVPPMNTVAVTSMQNMFAYCRDLVDVPHFNTENCTVFTNMFQLCGSLQTIPLFDTRKATAMNGMFSDCASLARVPQFVTTPLLTATNSMFFNCLVLQDVPWFDTSGVNNANAMFQGCVSLETVPQFDFSSCLTMANTFNGCVNLKEITLLNTGKCWNFAHIFFQCQRLKYVGPLDTSRGQQFYNMFYNCLDLKSIPDLDTTAAGQSYNMFYGCTSLPKIPALDFSYNVKRLRGPYLYTSEHWTISGTGWSFGTSPPSLVKNVEGTGTILAKNPYCNDGVSPAAIFGATAYKVVVDATVTAGSVTPSLAGVNGSAISTTGVSTHFITTGGTVATAYSKLLFTPTSAFRGVINSVTVEEVVNTTTFVGGCNSLVEFLPTGIRRSISLANCKLSKDGIIAAFNNLGTADAVLAADKTVTITGNHGAASQATLANPCSDADDILDTTADHPFVAGDSIRFTTLTGGSGLNTSTTYYVIAANLGARTFQISTTPGGAPANFGSNITAGTVRYYYDNIAIAKGWTVVN